MTAKDVIGPWPKHPIALAASQSAGRKRQSAVESRIIRVDGKAELLRDIAREFRVPPGKLAAYYRKSGLNTRERLREWSGRIKR
jgi:hypothetical protein